MISFLRKSYQLLMTGPSDSNKIINASPSRITSFRKTRSYVSFHTLNLNNFITSYHYNYTVKTGTSEHTDTTRNTIPDTGQIHTLPKIIPYGRPNKHTLHALYSVRTQIVHRFQIPLTVRNIYCRESYSIYSHIMYSGFPWPRTC